MAGGGGGGGGGEERHLAPGRWSDVSHLVSTLTKMVGRGSNDTAGGDDDEVDDTLRLRESAATVLELVKLAAKAESVLVKVIKPMTKRPLPTRTPSGFEIIFQIK